MPPHIYIPICSVRAGGPSSIKRMCVVNEWEFPCCFSLGLNFPLSLRSPAHRIGKLQREKSTVCVHLAGGNDGGTIWGVSHSLFRQRRVNGVDKVYYAEICLWPVQSVQHRKQIWTDIARWTSRWRRRHRYLFIASKAHIRVDNSRRCFFFFFLLRWYRRCFTRATRNKSASSTCALCQVSVNCTESYHLIAIRININSIFITLHLPLCGCKVFAIFDTRTQHFSLQPILWERNCLVAGYVTMYFEVHRTNDPKQNVFTALTTIRYRKDFGEKLPRDAKTCHTNLFIAFKTNSQLAVWVFFLLCCWIFLFPFSSLNYSNYDNKLRWNGAHSECRHMYAYARDRVESSSIFWATLKINTFSCTPWPGEQQANERTIYLFIILPLGQ